MSQKISTTLAVLACCATWANAQDFDIKPGLWEITTTRETKGDPLSMMSAADKAHMEDAKAYVSPQQRAQMEAFIKAQAASAGVWAKPSISRACMTKENIHQTIAKFTADKGQSNCKITPVRSSATVVERREVCSSENRSNSKTTLLFEAPNPETLIVYVDGSVSGANGMYELKLKIVAKWLGDCQGMD